MINEPDRCPRCEATAIMKNIEESSVCLVCGYVWTPVPSEARAGVSCAALVGVAGGACDRNVESVRAKLHQRAERGLSKYGVTTERTDLDTVQWLRHAQEEALDLAVYLERLIADLEAALAASPPTKQICHPSVHAKQS